MPWADTATLDPTYVKFKADILGYAFRFAELSHEINSQMEGYVDRVAELQV